MPGKVKVKILAGRNLPVMDRSSDTTDAYVEIKLGSITQKTDVFRKSLNPKWNSEWFIFEVDDADLQDEPLQIRLMDYDTYSANDAIGKVYLDLNPLLVPPGHLVKGTLWSESCAVPPSGGVVLSGWLPVFDTMHGMRGEVSVIVKVELFSDVNKFRQSSCGVQFFNTASTPCGFKVQSIQGFVKELVVNDDPEYQWIDKIRTPRASNEARQTLFSQLSGEVRRKIGLKVLELGGNAVVGYQQVFDLEGETGLVVRGIGTSVTLVRNHSDGSSPPNLLKDHHSGRDYMMRMNQSEPVLCIGSHSPVSRLHRQSLPVHEDISTGLLSTPAPSSTIQYGSGRLTNSKTPMRRKVSLGNLFAKPGYKMKIQRQQTYHAPSPPTTLTVIRPETESSSIRAVSRVRSRSAPFTEMSPIQETLKETAPDSLSDHSLQIPKLSLEDMGVKVITRLEDSKRPVICFIGSSDDSHSCGSSDSEQGGLMLPNNSLDPSNDVAYATTFPSPAPLLPNPSRSPRSSAPLMEIHHTKASSAGPNPSPGVAQGSTPTSIKPPPCIRRSSDSEINVNVTPKGSSFSERGERDSVGSSGGFAGGMRPHRQVSAPNGQPSDSANLEVLEYPFLTMKTYPPGFIVHIGGTVSARSVKLLDRINNSEEPETRDNWWTEIRMEVRSHARALGCSVILGYEEHTSICEEVCVLSAAGTAAIVKLQPTDADVKETEHKRDASRVDVHHKTGSGTTQGDDARSTATCRVAHIPYSKANIPFPIKLSRCDVCRKGKVPDILIATIEPPVGLGITGRGCLIQARLCRPKRDESRGDQQAKEVSDGLPFLEYELHRQLVNKLKIKGMNAIFGLKVQVSVGERHMVGVATGTAVFLTALPAPAPPTTSSSNISSKQSKRGRIHKLLTEAHASNKEHYGLNKSLNRVADAEGMKGAQTDSEDSDEDVNDLDLSAGNKDTCVLEIDDAEDVDMIELLIDPHPPEGFDVVTTEAVPGLPVDHQRNRCQIQAFNRVWKGKIPATQTARPFNRCFEMILRSVFFKLRKSTPCVITNLQFGIDLPEDDEIQITVFGTAIITLGKALHHESSASLGPSVKGTSDNEMIFHLEDFGLPPTEQQRSSMSSQVPQGLPSARIGLDKSKIYVQKERQPVDITTLIRLPGSRVERYLGHLNFFFIRESTSIREDGGLSGFMQSFITEVLAIVRAHVSALGGNAMVAYFMTQCVLLHNPHKNQGQCLINVGGDVVQAVRYHEDRTQASLPL